MMYVSVSINGKFVESVAVQQVDTLEGDPPHGGHGEARYNWAWTEDTGIEGKGRFVVHQGQLIHRREDGALVLAAKALAAATERVSE